MNKIVPLLLFSFFSIFQLHAQNNITFKVDMNNYTGTYTQVYVSGSFNAWSGTANPMSDTDGDGIYELTIGISDPEIHYLFTVDDLTDQESFAGGEYCTQFNTGQYRRHLVIASDSILTEACWNDCYECNAPPPPMVDVTFQIDMTEYPYTFEELIVVGDFNDWNYFSGDNLLYDFTGTGVYSITMALPAGSTEYRFHIGFPETNIPNDEIFTTDASCILQNGNELNHYLSYPTDTSNDLFCWNTCESCNDVSEGNITFQLDMSQFSHPFYSETDNINIQVIGDFYGGYPIAPSNYMSDSDGDGIYTFTTPTINPGMFRYGYIINSGEVDESTANMGECIVMGPDFYGSRTHYMTGTITLDPVCWESCAACIPQCGPPQNVQHQLSYPSKLNITWDEQPGAERYDVLYRPVSSTDWTRVGALNNYKTLHYLQPNTQYVYRVRSYCNDSWDFANATGFRHFNTSNIPPMRQAGETNTDAHGLEVYDIYPNPVSDYLTLELSTSKITDVQVSIIDMTGKTLGNEILSSLDGDRLETIDVSHLAKGYYMMVIQSGEDRVVKKFAKMSGN